MMKFLTLLSTTALFFCTQIGFAQLSIRQDTLVWNTSAYIVETADSASRAPKLSKFVTYGDSLVTWTQNRSVGQGTSTTRVIRLQVTGVTGEWLSLNEDGQIVYSLLTQSGSGFIRFRRSGTSIVIHVELTGSNGGKITNDFEVIDYQKK